MHREDKGWAMKRARPSKKMLCSGLGLNYGSKRRHDGFLLMSLKGFVNRLSHYCHIDCDRDVSTAHCRSSSVFQLITTTSASSSQDHDALWKKIHQRFPKFARLIITWQPFTKPTNKFLGFRQQNVHFVTKIQTILLEFLRTFRKLANYVGLKNRGSLFRLIVKNE